MSLQLQELPSSATWPVENGYLAGTGLKFTHTSLSLAGCLQLGRHHVQCRTDEQLGGMTGLYQPFILFGGTFVARPSRTVCSFLESLPPFVDDAYTCELWLLCLTAADHSLFCPLSLAALLFSPAFIQRILTFFYYHRPLSGFYLLLYPAELSVTMSGAWTVKSFISSKLFRGGTIRPCTLHHTHGATFCPYHYLS